MAKLYKMELYVCDIEESLTLEEIKTLIEQDALSGIAVNCICKFHNEKEGKRIKYGDDTDINRIDCDISTWEKYFK